MSSSIEEHLREMLESGRTELRICLSLEDDPDVEDEDLLFGDVVDGEGKGVRVLFQMNEADIVDRWVRLEKG